MEFENILKKIEEFFSKYIIFILIFLIVTILFMLLLSNKKEEQLDSRLTLNLKGSTEISIIKGETYQEPGFIAYDSKEGDLSKRVTIEGYVNSNIIGTYTIIYRVSNTQGKIVVATRKVNVIADLKDLSIDIDYNPEELTNKDVTIVLKISGDGYDFLLDPDGNISRNNVYIYKASENDEYLFSIKRKDGVVIEKSIEITNIDKNKPTGSCKNTVTLENSSIVVTASDESEIKNYLYNLNNENYSSTLNTYSVSGTYRNASVTIYDKAGNYEIIKCNTIDNTWPIKEVQNEEETSAKYYDQTRKYGRLNYILYYPNDLDLTEKNPLVVFLHGSGEFDSDINEAFNKNTTFVNNMKSGKFQQKAVFLAPQCNSGNHIWKECFDDLKGLIDEIIVKYNIDSNRISVAGHSLGGAAVFDLLAKWPGFFSAAVPLAPAGGSSNYEKMKDVKIVVFAGSKDGLYRSSQRKVSSMQEAGIAARFYSLEGIGHATQPSAFNEYNLIEWMISQSR
ncbi:MAG: DUF5011 domain-containing protein [Bacilli bacterium]|nr:DUF5011 domain-containing protein [Bacilli bacterium]